MAKRKTKQQRIAAEKAALRQRLEDIARGAWGWFDDPAFLTDTDISVAGEFTAESLGNFLMALTSVFDLRNEQTRLEMRLAVDTRNFDLWDKSWPAVIDALYEWGFRA